MANKRMFSMSIVDSDAFLDMPASTQNFYFHLNMRADDDGFIGNPKKIQRMIGASDDDLKVLIAKRFVLAFDDGVIVIKHWRMHNTLRFDRYYPTVYQDEFRKLLVGENKAYSINSGNQLATDCKPNVIPSGNTDIDLDIDIDLDKDKETKKAREKKSKPFFDLFSYMVENEKLVNALVDYAEFRRRKKAALTDKACELLLSKLDKLAGNDDQLKIEILNQSILNGWSGIFELKGDSGGKNKSKAPVANTAANTGQQWGTVI